MRIALAIILLMAFVFTGVLVTYAVYCATGRWTAGLVAVLYVAVVIGMTYKKK